MSSSLKSLGLARTGSIPVVRTIFNIAKTKYHDVVVPVAQWLEPAAHNRLVEVPLGPPRAGVAELVDALDLGSSGASCGVSSPSARTIDKSPHHTLPYTGGDEAALNAAAQERRRPSWHLLGCRGRHT